MTSTLGIKKIQHPNGTNIATLDSSGSIAFAGASTVAGTLGVTGVLTGTSLDISGDIDIDGTSNLDVVDIDGAVNMASTLIVSGTTTIQKASSGGTANSSAALVIEGTDATKAHIQLLCDNSDVQSIYFGDAADNDIGRIAYDHTGNTMRFNVNAAERMRINSSGTVMIGRTATGYANTGAQFTNSGAQNIFVADGDYPLGLNRQNSSGIVLDIRHDGTSVGSIQERFNNIQVGTGETNLLFNNGSNEISPSSSSGGTRDNTTDLGANNRRWKNIWVGTGVYLGGTASANQLEDYEEGSWTAQIIGSSVNPSSSVTVTGNYIKIGLLVYVTAAFANVNTAGASGEIRVTGAPFTPSPGNQMTGNVTFHSMHVSNTTDRISNISPFFTGSHIVFYGSSSGNAWSGIQHTSGGYNGGYLYFTGSYLTT